MTDVSPDNVALPAKGAPNYNEGQELPVEPFADDHQSFLPRESHACEKCGVTSEFGVPDDTMAMVWECPACEHRNSTPGHPANAVAVAQATLEAAQAHLESLAANGPPIKTVLATDGVGTAEGSVTQVVG